MSTIYRDLLAIHEDSCTTAECYFMTAQEHYNAALLTEFSIESGFHNIKHNIKLMKSIQDTYGIEAFQGHINQETDQTNPFMKIINRIVEFFRHLIMVIGNFIRGIMNTIGSLTFRKQEEFYNNHKYEFERKFKELNNKGITKTLHIHCKLPNKENSIKQFQNIFPKCIKGLEHNADTLHEYGEDIKRIVSDVVNDRRSPVFFNSMTQRTIQVGGIRTLLNGGLGLFPDFEQKIQKNIIFGLKDTGISVSLPTPVDIGLLKNGPSRLVKIILYGEQNTKSENKYTKTTVKGVFDKGYLSIEYLSPDSKRIMQKFVDDGRKVANKINNEIITCKKIMNSARKIISGNAPQKKQKKYLNCYLIISKYSRLLKQFIIGMILNIFAEFIRLRTYVFRAAKLVMESN